MNKFDVIGFGDIAVDYFSKTTFSLSQHEMDIEETLMQAGGSAANTLCALSKLGLQCGAAGRVGIDDKANVLINSFYDHKVDFSQISIDRKHNTGYSHIYVDRFGKRTMFSKPGSNSTLDKHHINLKYFSATTWLHYGDFLDEKQFELQLWIAENLRGNVKFSLRIDGHVLKMGYKQIQKILPFIDILFIKEHTLQSLVSAETIEAAEKMLSDGVNVVCIIQNAYESIIISKDERHQLKSIKTSLHDESGISCAFATGVLFGQLHGYNLNRSAFLGNSMMSFCAKKLGCQSNYPTLQDLTKRTVLLKEDKNVLIIGSGGREHAIAWKLHQSPRVRRLYVAPGNPGISEVAHTVRISETDIKKLKEFVKAKDIDITIVGPEVPLGKGITDAFEKEGLAVFGPSQKAAELETSKSFSKKFMKKFKIPTAKFTVFSSYKRALAYLQKNSFPIVIKADGLAAGKGVMVCPDKPSANHWLKEIMLDKKFGDAGKKVVIEECLEGEEASVLAFSDGEHVIPLLPAQDHKRIFDGDSGPNTGGMGAYAPAPVINEKLLEKITKIILEPTIAGMKQIGRPYKGILYAGIMVTKDGPKVLEFNCRFGDPETQAVLPLLKTDLLTLIESTLLGRLEEVSIDWEDESCICIVAASGGYPGKPDAGKVISGLHETNSGSHIFHSGTKSQIITSGGRVLGVVSTGKNLQQAIKKAYREMKHVSFENMHHRKDIGKKGIAYNRN